MAISLRDNVANLNQVVPIACAGQTTVGIKISGTFVGTLTFQGSTDGLNFYPINVTPYQFGTAVNNTTTTGNWFVHVKNYVVIRVQMTAFTSGSANVALSTSQDGSFQDIFVATTVVAVNSIANNATNTNTFAAVTGVSPNIQSLKVTVNGQPAWLTSPNLQIWDGAVGTGNLLMACDLPLSGSAGIIYDIALPPATPVNPKGGYTGTVGNAMNVTLCAAGAGKVSNINATYTQV